jgi:hypothetical protein
LLTGVPEHPSLREYWLGARSDSFALPTGLLNARRSKLQ